MRTNHVKRRLKAGEPSIGTWLSLPSPESAEYVSTLGLDWLVVDAEHNSVDLEDPGADVHGDGARADRADGPHPLEYPGVLQARARCRCLGDRRPERADARGGRAGGSGHPLSPRWASAVSAAVGTTSASTPAAPSTTRRPTKRSLLVLMIEHAKGVENADAILSTPGVDACFIGPNDMAASMGLGLGVPLESDNARLVAAIKHVRETCKKHGVAPGIHTSGAEGVNQRIAEGFQFCALASELRYMLSGLRDDIGAAELAARRDRHGPERQRGGDCALLSGSGPLCSTRWCVEHRGPCIPRGTTMRVAAIYDIHGNLPALEAVLRAIEQEAPDLIVVGGDVAAGPLPRPTIERLMALGPRAHCVRGNADREMVAVFDGQPLDPTLPQAAREQITWSVGQIDRAHRDFLASFTAPVTYNIEGLGDTIFCHGSPRDEDEIVTARTSNERLAAIVAPFAQPLVVCGHTHMQFDRRSGNTRVSSMPGASGCPTASLGPTGRCSALWSPCDACSMTSTPPPKSFARVASPGRTTLSSTICATRPTPPRLPPSSRTSRPSALRALAIHDCYVALACRFRVSAGQCAAGSDRSAAHRRRRVRAGRGPGPVARYRRVPAGRFGGR